MPWSVRHTIDLAYGTPFHERIIRDACNRNMTGRAELSINFSYNGKIVANLFYTGKNWHADVNREMPNIVIILHCFKIEMSLTSKRWLAQSSIIRPYKIEAFKWYTKSYPRWDWNGSSIINWTGVQLFTRSLLQQISQGPSPLTCTHFAIVWLDLLMTSVM